MLRKTIEPNPILFLDLLIIQKNVDVLRVSETFKRNACWDVFEYNCNSLRG